MAYADIGDWSELYYPPPYDFLAPPRNSNAMSRLQPGGQCTGLGCASCGGTCGNQSGMGQATGEGLFGTGLFQSADPSTWGIGEWSVIAIGGFLAISAVTTAQSAGRAVSKGYRKAKKSVGF